MRKICKKCKIEKDLDDFYKHKLIKGGRVNFCKKCQKERIKNNPNRFFNEWKRRQKTQRKKYTANFVMNYFLKYPKRRRVYNLVSNSIKNGKLKKQLCEKCGSLKVYAHHDDYNQPLKVKWLCPQCHSQLHSRLNKLKPF